MPDFRSVPGTDKVIGAQALAGFPVRVRRTAARGAVAQARLSIAGGASVTFDSVVASAVEIAAGLSAASLRPAINMSGVVLHTGLGRARLAKEAVEQVHAAAQGHSLLELDDESGRRGDRQSHVHDLLTALTGAEAALVVNNCASAVFLSLQALCGGKAVLLSRGEMVEIGGSFRMPEIVAQSGCSLVEVGTTNKTRVTDYEKALTKEVAAVLRCHPSNFQIVGFHEEPAPRDLSELCKKHGLALIDDVGSGCLLDTAQFGLPHERTVQEAVKDGADVVTASGDKLLGGPQAGIIVGKKGAVEKLRSHPLARAVRIDKLTLAALEATLRLYVQDRHREVPVWRYLSRPLEEVKALAQRLAAGAGATVEEGKTEVGGGSMPGANVPTYRVRTKRDSPEDLAAALRARARPIVGYVADGAFWLDPRTAEPDEVDEAARALSGL